MIDESGVCTCRGADPQSGYRYDEGLDLWVHSPCGKPTRMYLDTLYQRALEEEYGTQAQVEH